MPTYKEELTKAMGWLGQQENTIFIGQSIVYGGNSMFDTFKDVPIEKKIEVGIMEDSQMGICIGLALQGFIPVSIYPRMDFLILAINQLVNHLDKIEAISRGQFQPKVIIRTMVGSKEPLYPGPQHCQDHTEALRLMLTNVEIRKISSCEEVMPTYKYALQTEKSIIVVEHLT